MRNAAFPCVMGVCRKKDNNKTRATVGSVFTLVFLVAFYSARGKGIGADCGEVLSSGLPINL
jgi:hypothetical protein